MLDHIFLSEFEEVVALTSSLGTTHSAVCSTHSAVCCTHRMSTTLRGGAVTSQVQLAPCSCVPAWFCDWIRPGSVTVPPHSVTGAGAALSGRIHAGNTYVFR